MLAKAYEQGKISQSDFKELFYYLKIELKKVDKKEEELEK